MCRAMAYQDRTQPCARKCRAATRACSLDAAEVVGQFRTSRSECGGKQGKATCEPLDCVGILVVLSKRLDSVGLGGARKLELGKAQRIAKAKEEGMRGRVEKWRRRRVRYGAEE